MSRNAGNNNSAKISGDIDNDKDSWDANDMGLIELGKYEGIWWSKVRYSSENCDDMKFSIVVTKVIGGPEFTEYDLIMLDTVDLLIYREINREGRMVIRTRDQ
eukprot:TRINITY_DN6487_c0_g1_i12.p1 TRINITY_DN6487_c0_g1~~TRINITY_DN6487_c0_g1_i12.p1  ORF type:complete len:103 (-),score=9.59 TRINITY_DN6487_c0_g1_i12:68-376(-)